MTIKKAVILSAGMGTRFFPVAKSLPKELLPIVDTPVLSYIIDEGVRSGITDFLIVISPDKEIIKDYFTPSPKLEDALAKAGKIEQLDLIRAITNKANINFVYQEHPLGSGDAVMKARDFTGDDPFCLALGDDIIIGEPPTMLQLGQAYDEVQSPIIGVQYYPSEDIIKYGIAKIIEKKQERLFTIAEIVEKPPLDKIPSNMACLGRYVFDKSIYDCLNGLKRGKNGEYQLTDAINRECAYKDIFAYDFIGTRYDMGDKFSSLKAAIEISLNRQDFGNDLKEYIKELVKRI